MSSAGPISSGGGAAAVVQALDWKDAVETIADADIALTGEQTLKGLLTSASRVGVIGQTNADENGIYVSAAGAWARAVDADTDAKVTNGLVFVVGDSGSTEVGKAFILTTPDPIILDTTLLTFTLFVLALHASSHEVGGSDLLKIGNLPTDETDTTQIFAPDGFGGVAAVDGSEHDHTLADITDSGALAAFATVGTSEIDNNAVTNAKLADMPAKTIKARDEVSSGDPEDITPAELRGMISVEEGSVSSPPGHVDGLQLLFNTVSTVDVAVGSCRDKDDTFTIFVGGVLTADITASGADGLDTGAEASDTWYAVHVIGDSAGVNAPASLLSLSATAPTLPGTHDVSRLVGWIRNDSSSNILEFIMSGAGRDRLAEYQNVTRVNLRVLNNGSATSMTAVALASLVPTTSEKARMIGLAQNTSDNRHWAIAQGDSTLARADQPIRFGMNKDTGGFDLGGTPFDILLNTSQEVLYGVSDADVDLDLFALGYHLVI